MQTLNLVGAGKLGSTLARLWHRQQQFRIQQIVTRSQQSAQQAQRVRRRGLPQRRAAGGRCLADRHTR